jgi:hypothetical protein
VQELQIGGTGEPDYDEQIIARAGAKSPAASRFMVSSASSKLMRTLRELQIGADQRAAKTRKKRAAVSGGFKVDNREASNRVDRSHSVSKEDGASHI